VDFLVFDPAGPEASLRDGGRLADVAPTVLGFMGLKQPEEMTGEDLVSNRGADR
jgi:2,3-bisphosphoglycerate-independent phosphoglycerate mutase